MRSNITVNRKFTMTFSLAASFGLLITVVVGIILGTQLYAATKNTVDLAGRIGKLTTQLIINGLDDHFLHVKEQVEFVASAIVDGKINPASVDIFRNYLAGTMAGLPQVHAVAYVDYEMRAIGAERQSHEEGAHEPEVASFSANWRQSKIVRAAMEAVRGGEKSVWLSPQWHPRFGETVITIATKVSGMGKSPGIVIAWIGVDELSHLLSDVNTLSHTSSFILNGRKEVLSHSNMDMNRTKLGPDQPLPLVEDFVDPVLADIWEETAKIDSHMALGGELKFHAIEIDGKRYAFLYETLEKYGDIPWIIGGYEDFNVLHAEFQRLEIFAILGLIALVVSIMAAIVLGHQISKPVRRIATAARKVGDLDLDGVEVLPGSRIVELDNQARAFNSMVAGLRWFNNYVPKDLVRKLMRRGGEIAHEDRMVTVLFTDIVGFTPFSENKPAAEIAGFLNEHFALVVQCIEENKGMVDKFIGDAVMAVWGALETDEDQAENACRAAVAISNALSANNARREEQGEPPIHMRIGIHSGLAMVGNIGSPGRINYTIVGDVVNVASRIEAMAKTVQHKHHDAVILISEATKTRLPDKFATIELGNQPVRGRQDKIGVYMLKAPATDYSENS